MKRFPSIDAIRRAGERSGLRRAAELAREAAVAAERHHNNRDPLHWMRSFEDLAARLGKLAEEP